MTVYFKITRHLFKEVLKDLYRPHPYAYERVGFIFTKTGAIENNSHLVLATKYTPIPEEQYIDDPSVGARINATAIRTARQRILDTGEGAYHVHMHAHYGKPTFSPTDQAEQEELVISFKNASKDKIHGTMLLSRNEALVLSWLPEHTEPITARVSIVGCPISIFERITYERTT